MLNFLDTCSMTIKVNDPPNLLQFFTNHDILQGEIMLKTKQKLKVVSLNIQLNATSSTILLDSKGTFVTCENRNIYTESLALIIERTFTSGLYSIPFKFQLPGNSGSDTTFNLPPSMKYVGHNSSTKIDYSLNALLEKQNSKSPMSATYLFNFLPSPQYTSYSLVHNPNMPRSVTQSSFSFKYNAITAGRFNTGGAASLDAERQSKLKSFKRFSSRARKSTSPTSLSFNPFVDVDCPFSLSVEFSHAKVNNNKFAKGVLNVPDSLKDSINLFLISQYSAQELYAKLYKKPYEENNLYPEKLKISELKINLLSLVSFCCGKSILEGNKNNCLLGKSDLNYVVDFTKFKKIKFKNSVFYKYEIDPSIYDCIIRNDLSSFISSSVKLDHQLQIQAKVVSETSDNIAEISLNTDVILLNNLYQDYD